MLSPYVGAGILIALVAAYGTGRYDGARLEREGQQRSEKAAQVAYDAAMKATAEQLGKLTITNTTIRQKAEVIVRENTIYRECRHTPDGVQSINAALSGKPISDSQLPRTDAAN